MIDSPAVVKSPTRGDELLEKGTKLIGRYSEIHSKLVTVLQRLGLQFDSAPQSELDGGFGYLGRMDISLRVLYDLADDIEKQVDTLEGAF
jgi:hypothetical protein